MKEDDPYTITLERALELVAEKKKADAEKIINVFEEQGIQVLNGRYGPYVTDGEKNARIPKDVEPKSLTLADCEAMIAAAPDRRSKKKKKKAEKKTPKKVTKKTKKKTAKKKLPKNKKVFQKRSCGIYDVTLKQDESLSYDSTTRIF